MRLLVVSSIAFVTAFACASAAAAAAAPDTAPASASATAPASAPAAAPAVTGSLRVGFEVSARWFAFSDPLKIATNLRPYEAVGIPMLVLGGELRPLVWTRVPILRDLSVFGDYAFAPYLTSSVTGGQDIQTSYERGMIALRLPIRLGRCACAPVVAPRLGYGALRFDFQETGPLASEIPIASYKMVRIGLDGRSRIVGPLSGLVSFEWLEPIEGGALYERFRDPRIGGIDAWLGLALGIAKGTELSLSVGYTRFFSSFEPVPGDPYVAGGALDQFGGSRLGIDYAPE